jgi:uncharacterized protein (DUF983 family)
MCSETCPNCGEVNVFPGFSAMEAFTCRSCGEGVQVHTAHAMKARICLSMVGFRESGVWGHPKPQVDHPTGEGSGTGDTAP